MSAAASPAKPSRSDPQIALAGAPKPDFATLGKIEVRDVVARVD